MEECWVRAEQEGYADRDARLFREISVEGRNPRLECLPIHLHTVANDESGASSRIWPYSTLFRKLPAVRACPNRIPRCVKRLAGIFPALQLSNTVNCGTGSGSPSGGR